MIKKILAVVLLVYTLVFFLRKRCKYIMYGRDSCPYCVKMKTQLSDDQAMQDFRYIDITSDRGKKMFMSTGSTSVPFFVNQESGATVSGQVKTKDLIDELDRSPSKRLKGTTVYGSYSCGYTIKLIDELKNANVWNQIKFIDTDSKEGKQAFSKLSVDGVPYVVHPNGHSAHGFMKFEALLKKLNV